MVARSHCDLCDTLLVDPDLQSMPIRMISGEQVRFKLRFLISGEKFENLPSVDLCTKCKIMVVTKVFPKELILHLQEEKEGKENATG
jgi:hypothetical protein